MVVDRLIANDREEPDGYVVSIIGKRPYAEIIVDLAYLKFFEARKVYRSAWRKVWMLHAADKKQIPKNWARLTKFDVDGDSLVENSVQTVIHY